jgi:hypothetical protein
MFRIGIKSSGKWYCLLCQVVRYDTVSHQRRLELSTTLLWKPQILHTRYVAAPDRNIQQINVESGSTLLTLCSNDHASLISKYRWGQLDATNSDLLVISSISTCFGHLYAHHQETRLRSTACSCLPCCGCCDAGESGSKMCALCGECCMSQATFSTQCTHLSTRLSSMTAATTGQTTIGSGTQSDLLMMGIKMPETCWDTIDYQ